LAFNFATHGIKCEHGQTSANLMLLEESTACQKVSNSMKETVWAADNPLSASNFHAWHASLSDHRDAVKKLAAVWTIETSTSTGAIRDARFTLRQDAYQPLELYLQFSEEEEVTIKEDARPLPNNLIASHLVPTWRQASSVSRSNDPADMLEVQAWQILHDLNVDSPSHKSWSSYLNNSQPSRWTTFPEYTTITQKSLVTTIHNPWAQQTAFGIEKKFSLSERADLQFKAEAFNATNTPIFAGPSTSSPQTPVARTSVSNPDQPGAWSGYGTIGSTQQNFPRRVQLSLKILF
jgi:hypothetical protein